MKITNKKNVPETIYRFLVQNFYDTEAAKGTLSATTFNKPVQEIVLCERYDDVIEVDCMDLFLQVLGSGVHAVLEKAELSKPSRMYAPLAGVVISGKADSIVIANNRVNDYKCTSVWSVVYGSKKDDWKMQLSIYRWLHWKETGHVLDDTGAIIPILRDWQETKALEGGKYPSIPMMEIPIKLFSFDEIEGIMTEKIGMLAEARLLPDNKLPKCTDDERWRHWKTGKYNKCERYCNASKFCKQFNAPKVEEEIEYAEVVA